MYMKKLLVITMLFALLSSMFNTSNLEARGGRGGGHRGGHSSGRHGRYHGGRHWRGGHGSRHWRGGYYGGGWGWGGGIGFYDPYSYDDYYDYPGFGIRIGL
jgi:uncharacterized membrane protein